MACTTAAVTRGGDYLMTLTTQNPRFIVLVTDGLTEVFQGDEEFGPDDVPTPSPPPVEPISPTTVGVASKNAATPTGS